MEVHPPTWLIFFSGYLLLLRFLCPLVGFLDCPGWLICMEKLLVMDPRLPIFLGRLPSWRVRSSSRSHEENDGKSKRDLAIRCVIYKAFAT